MLADIVAALLAWIEQNPHWAYLAVFLVAAGESLIVVGLVLPGVALMFGVGAVVATGALDLGPTLAWAAAGAMVGDGVSFWIGRRFHMHLRGVWPFARHPELLEHGVAFFRRHGTMSVVLARFVGPVRPILPAVAGMLEMPPRRFFFANACSALLWAPAYTLPGVVFGASLGLAAEVAGRLAVLIAVIVGAVWFGLWSVRRLYRALQPHAGLLLARGEAWSRAHSAVGPIAAAVLDPNEPETRGLAILLLALAVAGGLLAWLAGGWLGGLDLYLRAVFEAERTPAADRVLVFVTGFGELPVLLTVLAAGSVWLTLTGRLSACLHWLTASVSAVLLSRLVDMATAVPRPADLLMGVPAPSGTVSLHVGLALAVYGFLAILVARELSPARRWWPYSAAGLTVLAIAFSRVYLGAEWFSDVLAGVFVGLACVALLGIAYRRHPARPLGWPRVAAVAALALVLAGGWWMRVGFAEELARRAPHREAVALDLTQWWAEDWRRLAEYRHDFRVRDRQPLNIQYAGDPSDFARALVAQGWRPSTDFSGPGVLHWIAPQPALADLPVLPQVHDGRYDVMRLMKAAPDGEGLYVVRLWATSWRLRPDGTRLWVGSVAEMAPRRPFLFTYLVTGPAGEAPLAALHRDLATCCATVRHRHEGIEEDVLLVRAGKPDGA